MPRPILATINPHALTHNLCHIRQRLHSQGVQPKLWAVIKANAYGHGIQNIYSGLQQADGLAMLDLNEAVLCRELGWQGPLLLLEGFFNSADLELIQTYDLTVTVHHEEQLRLLEQTPITRPISVYLKLNTGMNRLGFSAAHYVQAFERLQSLVNLHKIKSLSKMTHFANADGEQGVQVAMQRFLQVTAGLPGNSSVCNSAATWRYPEIANAVVRTGVIIYGSSPFDDESADQMGLIPVMSLSSELISVQNLKAGDQVGYGGIFTAQRAMRIGVVACGYADGYPRHAPLGTPVVVGGVRTQVVGRVSMDMLTVDLTPVPMAAVGTPVSLWGQGGPSVDEVAKAAGTIGYELLCALAPRVPLHVLNNRLAS